MYASVCLSRFITASVLESALGCSCSHLCACAFVLAGVTSSQAWAGVGAALRNWLARGWRLRVFNGAMAALIALSGFYLLQADL